MTYLLCYMPAFLRKLTCIFENIYTSLRINLFLRISLVVDLRQEREICFIKTKTLSTSQNLATHRMMKHILYVKLIRNTV